MHRPSKVRYLQLPIYPDQQILRLYVSLLSKYKNTKKKNSRNQIDYMYDFLAVAVFEGMCEISYVCRSPLLSEPLLGLTLQLFVHLSSVKD